ncbi:MAG TPA: MT-A70 family methyltransferase [Armatimonadota bacterium]
MQAASSSGIVDSILTSLCDFIQSLLSSFRVIKSDVHSRKSEEIFPIIESCSPGTYLELFARHDRPGWAQWGNEVESGIGDLNLAS